MSIRRYTFREVGCDFCGVVETEFDNVGSSVADVRRMARMDGWVRVDGKDMCPVCVSEGVSK